MEDETTLQDAENPGNDEEVAGSESSTEHVTQVKKEKLFTQEELNTIIGERLAREREKVAKDAQDNKLKESGEYKELYEKSLKDLEEARKENKSILRSSLVAKIAAEMGIPQSFADRIIGNTEEEIRKDAEEIASLLTPIQEEKPKKPDLNLSGGQKSDVVSEEQIKRLSRFGINTRYLGG